jgi:O-antigen/teichoic acid export membrane protein
VAGPRPPLLASLRTLAGHSAIYGTADVLGNLVNFLLVPLYTAFLSPAEYGTLALLLAFSALAKIAFRLQLDSGFFRIYYDHDDPEERRRLVGSVLLFSALAGGALLALLVLVLGPLTALVLGGDTAVARRLVLLAAADVFMGSFAFVPLLLLRIDGQAARFAAYSTARHFLNTLLKVALVLLGFGIAGVLVADLLATTALALGLLPVLRGRVRAVLDRALLRPVISFSLPRVPHAVMVQALNMADRFLLDRFVSRAELGTYQVAYTFGTGVKFALSAFEPAWQPFVYAEARAPGARERLARLATPVFVAFVAVGTGFAVVSPELLALMTPANPEFRAAAPVIPVVAFAYVLHGLFLLTSVGLGIAKRTGFYPAITAAAAATNIGANLLLVPRLGIMGAAWATLLGYAVMAGLGAWASARAYPIPFSWPRLLGALAAGALCAALSRLAPDALGAALAVKVPLLLLCAAALVLALRRRPRP